MNPMQPENGKNWKKSINYEGKFFTLLKHGKHGIQITLENRDCVYGQWVKSYSVIQHFRKQVTVFIFHMWKWVRPWLILVLIDCP